MEETKNTMHKNNKKAEIHVDSGCANQFASRTWVYSIVNIPLQLKFNLENRILKE